MSTTEDAKSERSRLEMENRGCRHCGGNGMAIVFHPRWSGGRHLDGAYPAEVAAHCSCPLGCWMRDRTDPQLQRRIPWIADIEAGRSRWLLSPPPGRGRDEHGNVADDDESDDATAAPTRAQIARLFRPAGGAA